jgi:hypothetical protein
MPIDTSIYSSLLRPPKSVADYDAEAQGRQQNALALQQGRQQLMMGQMKADEYTRGLQEQQQIRNALAGLGREATDEQRIQTLKGTGLPGGFAQADALEKTLQERKKTGADVSYKEAQTAKERAAVADAAIKRYRGALDFIDTPEGAARWMAAQYQDPTLAEHMQSMGPLDQVLQRIPSDPQGFQQWRQQAGMGMENYAKKLQADATIAETGRHNKAGEGIQIRGQDRQSADNAAARAVQMRGQNLVDARSRDATAMSAANKTAADGKPLPGSALKMQQEALDAIGVASTITADLKALEKQIDDGKLKFGPVSNLVNKGLNLVGRSTEESRNLSTFKSSLERLRNESLRLNTGVQTDGDAQRAWNELLENITDTELVKQRLKEIQAINKRGTELQRLKVDGIRANYGKAPLETDSYTQQPPAVGARQPAVQSGTDLGGGFRVK